MRKLKGYIGALIIVMALMGSILAGYALNVNGSTTTVNEYEKITDVSGLYSHSQEKTYLEYNPASNYTGYETAPQSVENTTQYTYKTVGNGTITFNSANNTISAFGTTYAAPSNPVGFWCDKFWLTINNGSVTYIAQDNYAPGIVSSMTIVINGNNITISDTTGFSKTWQSSYDTRVLYYTGNDWNYSRLGYNESFYYTDNSKIFGVANTSPAKPGATLGSFAAGVYTKFYPTDPSYSPWEGVLNVAKTQDINNGIYEGKLTINNATVSGVNYTIQGVHVFAPRTINTTNTLGINYTESNRVNNYPMEYEHSDTIMTYDKTINLNSVTTTNYWPNTGSYISQQWHIGDDVITQGQAGYTMAWDGLYLTPALTKYKLSDILATQSLPLNTISVSITTGSITPVPVYVGLPNAPGLDPTSFVLADGVTVPSNMVAIVSSLVDSTQVDMTNISAGWTANYNPSTGLVDIYTTNGVKISTSSIDNTYVQFPKNASLTGITGDVTLYNNGTPIGTTTGTDWKASTNGSTAYTNAAVLQMSYTTAGNIDNTKYMDISKGISIKSGNVGNVIWDNTYENGRITILFRAAETTQTYSNTLEISGNTIAVDYTTNRFYVELNGGGAVDIGTWRSILLDVDLLAGKVYVSPVRTFNSFTNVLADNTRVFIGDMTDAAPTNTIQWLPTTNSLTFNIYNTDVFLDTYGAVMVNPDLTVTDYFTDLNNFYRLDLYNFALVGESMTVNDVVGTVNGNTITFNDETVDLKELKLTYADGHAYVEDSHAVIDLGEIVSNNISLSGVWFFLTDLQRGFTDEKMIYEWDWQDFILDNTQFAVIYIGLALIGLVIAKRFCTISVIDYLIFGASIIIALSVQVIA